MRLKRGDISGPILAILVTLLLLIAIGVAIIAYFTFFAGGTKQPVISITGQPVAYKSGKNNAVVDIFITNAGSVPVTLSENTKLEIVAPTDLAETVKINKETTVYPGELKTLSFNFGGKWGDFSQYRFATGILTLVDTAGNTVGVLELNIRIIGSSSPGVRLVVNRNALYSDTFDDNPFPSRLSNTPRDCRNGWDAERKAIWIEDIGFPTMCYVTIQRFTPPQVGEIFVAFNIMLSPPSTDYSAGGIFLKDPYYYSGTIDKLTRQPWDVYFVRAQVSIYRSNGVPTGKLDPNRWFSLVFSLRYSDSGIPSQITLWWAPTVQQSIGLTLHHNPGLQMVPDNVGLYVRRYHNVAGGDRAYFDNLLITHNRYPWLIEVRGLQSGWRVVLKDSTGSIIAEEVSQGSSVNLNVWG
ncbi:MAG: hypothetical protein QXI24_07125, partial [Acidilobaceae archaeon]